MSDYWFKPKSYGYGASPTDWRGWALILGVVAGNLLLAFLMLVRPILAGGIPSVTSFILFLVLDTLLVAALLFVVRKKTEGDWRWRWGGK